MELIVDTTCCFIKKDGHTRKRWILWGKEERVPETFRFRVQHRSKEFESDPGISTNAMEAMVATQCHTPVLLMVVGSRHWWWFRGSFYQTRLNDVITVKRLLLEREAVERKRAEQTRADARDTTRQQRAQSRRKTERTTAPDPRCPYRTLDVPRTATMAEIKAAYRKRLTEYHPDKVASLGIELRNLAEEMTRRINEAYEELCARHR